MVDRHVVKMPTEHAQMLSTACRLWGLDVGMKSTHLWHPCSVWVRESRSNFLWLVKLTSAIEDEWRNRYGHSKTKEHKGAAIARSLPVPKLPDIPMTPFAQAMPEQYRSQNAIDAYRSYYIGEKQHLATWKHNQTPSWFIYE